MNDDFLHRLRKAPPPEFLAGLKAKLERQTPPLRTRRLSFSRGLFVGALLATTAFAVTSLSINSAPQSFREFLTAPGQLLARLGGGPSSEDLQNRGAAPLGPAWLPTHAAPRPQGDAPETENPAAAVASSASASATVASASSVSPEARPQSGIAATGLGTLNVIATASLYPHAQTVADRLSKFSGQMRVSLDKNGNALKSLCDPALNGNPSVAELYHRVTPAELRDCPLRLTEFAVGHQAIVLARGRLYGPLRLTARDLFLALARQVPTPTDPTQLIDNPNTNWNQVDGTLPYDRIRVFGPHLSLVQGKLAAALLLEAGCNAYPWIADLRASDPARYDEICKTVRGDGAYAAWEGDSSYTDNLVRNPTTLGVFTLPDFERSDAQLVANFIDGVAHSAEAIVAGTYPAARTLYLYVNTRYSPNSLFDRVLGAYLRPLSVYDNDPANWGFVALSAAERADIQVGLKRYQDANF